MNDGGTERKPDIVCPACGHVHRGSWPVGSFDEEILLYRCEVCKALFEYTRYTYFKTRMLPS